MKRLSIIIVAAVTLSGCASTSQDMTDSMKHLVGQHKSTLYQEYGPPTDITSDGKDGEILIYDTQVINGQKAGAVVAQGNTVYYTNPETVGYNKTRMFYVDGQGVIYGFRWKGR